MENEPRYYTDTKSFCDFNLEFKGEQYKGSPILDTSVKINGQTLCWINWQDKEQFVQELRAIINRFKI